MSFSKKSDAKIYNKYSYGFTYHIELLIFGGIIEAFLYETKHLPNNI